MFSRNVKQDASSNVFPSSHSLAPEVGIQYSVARSTFTMCGGGGKVGISTQSISQRINKRVGVGPSLCVQNSSLDRSCHCCVPAEVNAARLLGNNEQDGFVLLNPRRDSCYNKDRIARLLYCTYCNKDYTSIHRYMLVNKYISLCWQKQGRY